MVVENIELIVVFVFFSIGLVKTENHYLKMELGHIGAEWNRYLIERDTLGKQLKDCAAKEQKMVDVIMEEYMERPRGVKMIYAAGGDPLCTSHQRKGLYG